MPSEIFELSDRFISEGLPLSPISATYLGVPGYDHLMNDFSPAGHDARHEHNVRTLAALDRLQATNADDRLAAGVLRENLQADIEAHGTGEHLRAIRIIAGDVEEARAIFDLMPTDTAEHWQNIAGRMSQVPAAFAGMRESWRLGMDRGVVTSRRQALASAGQLDEFAGSPAQPGFFTAFVEGAAAVPGAPLEQLRTLAADCAAAMRETAGFLRDTYAPAARESDGCGEEAHAAARRKFLGAVIDPREAYEWGWEETMRLDEEIRRCGEQILPGATPAEVRHLLDTDPARMVDGEDNLRDWLQGLMDEAMSFLISEGHFRIDPRIRTVEAMISPPGGAAAMYYTSPSEDLSRPGRTWYPANGRTSFPRWGEPTTAYHEGVPGHHLQCATAVIEKDRLSRVQRIFFNSGHGEGWALYAERLMDEFGFLENPDYRLGYLYAQAFRAARVVVDLGIHCGFEIPKSSKWHPGEKWNPGLMLEFMSARSSSDDEFNRSEIERYLGWPGQAISYKLGERVWLRLRDDAKRRGGAGFDIAAWHDRALKLGNLGLDLLESELSAV